MSTVIEDPPEQTAASLVSGIVGDVQQLVEQQFQLTRRQIEEELRVRAAAASVLAVGLGVSLLGAMVLCLALVNLLHWAASPPVSDPAWLPLWGCHAVVAAVLLGSGGVLSLVGGARFRAVTPFQNPLAHIRQEHFQ